MNKISDEQTFFWLSGSQAHWATSRPRNGYSPKRCTERFFLMISERNFCEQRKCLLTARGVINGCNSQTGEAVYTVDFPEFYSEGCWFPIGEKLHWRKTSLEDLHWRISIRSVFEEEKNFSQRKWKFKRKKRSFFSHSVSEFQSHRRESDGELTDGS